MRNQKCLLIEIEGVDYSEYLTFPYTTQKTAKDQLNTAIITMCGMPQKEPFKPFSRVLLGVDKYSWVIANDSVKAVYGRGIWDHEITLVDATKMTERILMEAKSFTQPIQRDTTSSPSRAGYIFENDGVPGSQISSGVVKSGSYVSPISKNGEIYIYPLSSVLEGEPWTGYDAVVTSVKIYYSSNTAVTPMNKGIFTSIITPITIDGVDKGETAIIKDPKVGIYTIHYAITMTMSDANVIVNYSYYIPIAMIDKTVSSRYLSLHDVVVQTLQIAEPRIYGDPIKYALSFEGTQGDQFLTTRTPEFHFPNGRSLYENLREIGRVVHCIPRIEGYDKIVFKQLGANQYADISKLDEFAGASNFNVEDYASTIEANFANLINAEDESVGSVVAPYTGGYQSLRAIDGEFRITDTTGIIKLPFPIAKIISVNARYNSVLFNISKYIFEKEEYDSLSGFLGVYPYTKTHALYYTKGSNTIDGLWFRASESETNLGEALKKYAIENILNAENEDGSDWDFKQLSFQVTYIPIINGRARQEKIDFYGERNVLAYNQTASEISAKAFGENLRGQIAMLGTSNDIKTFLAKEVADVPEPGLLYDEDNYITQVTTRVFTDFCICELALTKNYNEISAYTELKTGIRQYEIPSGQDRYTLVEDFCYIGKSGDGDSNDTYCQDVMMKATLESFGTDVSTEDITSALITTKDDDRKAIAENIALPVYSTALGTSVYFGFCFSNNYSAGESSIDLPYADYRGTQYISYGDYFARAKYLMFYLAPKYGRYSNVLDVANSLPNGMDLYIPEGSIYVRPKSELIWNKDAADAGNVAYQMHFVTNDGWIITSELARMMKYVQAGGYNYSNRVIAYFYDSKINKITGEPREDKKIVKACEIVINTGDLGFYNVEIVNPPQDGSYESIVLKRADRPCIIGKNTSHLEPNKIYFTFRRRRDSQ